MPDLKQLRTKKGRDEAELFIIEGEKFIAEIPNDWEITDYLIAQSYKGEIAGYKQRAECTVVRDSIFNKLADTVNPQGIIAVCKRKQHTLDSLKSAGFFLLGENLNDPGNVGTLIRTAAAAGVDGVILTAGSCDVYNPKVLRASTGAAFRMPIVQDVSLSEIFVFFSAGQKGLSDIPVFAAHPRGNVTPYDINLTGNFCIVIGNETHGISQEMAARADMLITLPMANSTESLNASVAGSILLYEAVRQRIGHGLKAD